MLWEGLLVTVASRWTSSHSFMFESDSKLVVVWVVNHSSTSWDFYNLFRDCSNVFGSAIRWSIVHIDRIGNDAADVLDRIGSGV